MCLHDKADGDKLPKASCLQWLREKIRLALRDLLEVGISSLNPYRAPCFVLPCIEGPMRARVHRSSHRGSNGLSTTPSCSSPCALYLARAAAYGGYLGSLIGFEKRP